MIDCAESDTMIKKLMKPDTLDFNPFPTSSHLLPKICLHLRNKKSSMKPYTFNFKPFPSFFPISP